MNKKKYQKTRVDVTLPETKTSYLGYVRNLPLQEALWWFIENGNDDLPERNDIFFALRERVRTGTASRKARVLVAVSGGVAGYVSDDGIEVEVFDRDNYADDPDGTGGVPEHFRDLAEPLNIPVGKEREHGSPNPETKCEDSGSMSGTS